MNRTAECSRLPFERGEIAFITANVSEPSIIISNESFFRTVEKLHHFLRKRTQVDLVILVRTEV